MKPWQTARVREARGEGRENECLWGKRRAERKKSGTEMKETRERKPEKRSVCVLE